MSLFEGKLLQRPEFEFGTKAQTLTKLKSLVKSSIIGEVYYFEVDIWRKCEHQIIQEIEEIFGPSMLAIRSSAVSEDSSEHSMAGEFTSILNVDGTQRSILASAVNEVVNSMTGNPHDQILVQHMLQQVAVSGVITTHVLGDGAPYYVLNYDDESGRTDTVTGGLGVNKTVMIHHSVDEKFVESTRVVNWLDMARELFAICGGLPLDIEFAQTESAEIHVLQVRRIVEQSNWPSDAASKITEAQQEIIKFIELRSLPRRGLAGKRTIFGEMPDWNPAEIIGTSPRPLATSMYCYLVTDWVWRDARVRMGYRNPGDEDLMVMIGRSPYIDVRNSFNSFLPAGLNMDSAERLINAWIDRLDSHPELHDKVEFGIAQTVHDFCFDNQLRERYPGILTSQQFSTYKEELRQLTMSCLDMSNASTLQKALSDIADLEKNQAQRDPFSGLDSELDCAIRIKMLIEECRQLGTLPFSVIARHAFIAESMLRSAVDRGALEFERLGQFRNTVSTIMKVMSHDLVKVITDKMEKKTFLHRYGHLRPGTYDVLSYRYDQREDIFDNISTSEQFVDSTAYEFTPLEHKSVDLLLNEISLDGVNSNHLLEYAKTAINSREYSKFVFSKNLSDALEVMCLWGEKIGLSREDISYIPVEEVLGVVSDPVLRGNIQYFNKVIQRNRSIEEKYRVLRLGYLIRDIRDVYVIPLHRSMPNFVTDCRLDEKVVFINNRMGNHPDMSGRIICIENADPGFDWIFSRSIAGLITKFGGSNSHMAIRCSELGLPAAIGCGEQTFERIILAGEVELNCADKIVRPIYG